MRTAQLELRDQVFRPAQYLGCKLRSLTAIVQAVNELAPSESRVLDLFTGTSVVAQGLAVGGHQVVALDAMRYSAVFARATLGTGATAELPTGALQDLVSAFGSGERWSEHWRELAEREEKAICSSDGAALLAQAESMPQIWRQDGATPAQSEQFRLLDDAVRLDNDPGIGIATTHYAGTYFGLHQSLQIDSIRGAIGQLVDGGLIGEWDEAVALTALCSAASACAFSAGKHFAQPHRIRDGKDMTFLRRRILEDRRKDVMKLFAQRLERILEVARPSTEGHTVIRAPFENVSPEQLGHIDVVYADPPYTAQQYARFYHVLEVLVQNRVPALQQVRGQVTRGLYPEDRFASRFCSKRAAADAFRELLGLADVLSASLVLSYSATKTGSTGNDRMISLDELRAICGERFSPSQIRVVELSHVFRQFNRGGSAVVDRADGEYLIRCSRA